MLNWAIMPNQFARLFLAEYGGWPTVQRSLTTRGDDPFPHFFDAPTGVKRKVHSTMITYADDRCVSCFGDGKILTGNLSDPVGTSYICHICKGSGLKSSKIKEIVEKVVPHAKNRKRWV